MAEAPWRQAAVPAPPPGAAGHLPTSRLKAEISDRRAEPPLCVQNAMLTKDKKPFTYTPGGIDLSEIRSPRMARRLERNAMNEGVSSVPQSQQYHPTGPLPPSALAAMQPQLQVQVFPTGGVPQLPHGGPPPPPPPPKAPPMKLSPLPTDCYDRPDMTKIIPDNPMTLLRKTAGPIVKQDPILNKTGRVVNETPPQRTENVQHASPPKYVETPPQRQINIEPSPLKATSGVGSIYVPPVNQQSTEPSLPTSYSPPAYYKRQPSTPQAEAPKPQPQTPDSPKPSLSKAPTPWLTQRRQHSQDVPEWAVNDHRVQSPPVQLEPQQQWVPPEKTEPQPQTKPARPWQQQQHQQSPEPQARQQRQNVQQPEIMYRQQPTQHQYQPEPQWQQDRQPQQFRQEPQVQSPPIQKQGGGVRKQIQNRDRPQEFSPVEQTEVVVVNEPPLVYQHPGQTQQRIINRQVPYQQQQDPGVRIIPVQVEGRASNGQVRSPQPNSDARSFNRQLSWNSAPTQSNTFRVLQKITQTDGDDDDNQVVIEHSPRMHQQFPQRQQSMEQQRKWNQNDSDQALMNSFKQVPQEQQGYNSGPKVRTIPIQIEGNGSVKNYVPPSEQTVQEPKKYMGSSIPSRSFKMLQAMTAPDECVNSDQGSENNENYPNDPSSYTQWAFDPNHHPPPPPYCFDPYWNYFNQSCPSNSDVDSSSNPRMTPLPLPWGYYPPYYYVQNEKANSSESINKRNQRTTPISWQNGEGGNINNCAPPPTWPYYWPGHSENSTTESQSAESENQQNYAYSPYWNPYYYNYYYGAPPMYPPMYSPYPFYPQSDTEEVSGYSSNEEMAYYGARFASMPPYGNSSTTSKSAVKQSIKEQPPSNSCEKPEQKVGQKQGKIDDDDGETSDSDAEMIGYEVCRKTPGLQAIRSVSDIKVYDAEESSQCSDDESDNTTTEENEDTSSVCVVDDVIPHQLSVIFEESERTDSVRLGRESSVSTTISEGTATIENSDDEEAGESDNTVFVKLPLTLKFVIAESQKVATITVGDSKIIPQVGIYSTVEETCDNLHSKTDSCNSSNLESKIKDINNLRLTTEENSKEDDLTQLTHSGSGIDFWAHLTKDSSRSDVYVTPKKLVHERIIENVVLEREEEMLDSTRSSISSSSSEESSEVEVLNSKRSSCASGSGDEKSDVDFWAEIINDKNGNNVPELKSKDGTRSTCSSHSNLSSSNVVPQTEIQSNIDSISESDVKTDVDVPQNDNTDEKSLAIQDRIKMLQEAIAAKKKQLEASYVSKASLKERITLLQESNVNVNSDSMSNKDYSRKSSIKSYEECSEEEGDSGVTSDVSRHISEIENELDFLEMRQMNKYQRVSTHSRLFKLLQGECDNEGENVEEVKTVEENKSMLRRRDQLNLPLKQAGSDPESFSSSGFTSPGSPTVNDRLVNELIQSLLMKKQGRVFKNMTLEKLQAAALRILQDDMDGLETLSSSEDGGSFLSPKKNDCVSSPAGQEYYGNFNEYSQYYESWNEAAKYYEEQYDILPSKAFRLIQEHSSMNKTGAIAGLLARCPRVLSNKNVQKELMRLIQSSETPSPTPDSSDQSNKEATSAS